MQLLQIIKKRVELLHKKGQVDKETALVKELQDTHQQITMAQIYYDTLTNQDLIESCIFQMESLEVKYNYLVKQAKKMGVRYNEYIDIKEVESIDESDSSMDSINSVSGNHGVVLQAQRKTG